MTDFTISPPKAACFSRREILAGTVAAALAIGARKGTARDRTTLEIGDRLSPKNLRRPARPGTRYIILHTTEGDEAGSISKLQRRGEAHFVVTPSGRIYRIIDRQRIATHAGRSMWDGLRVIDNYSIGVEVVGYHDRDITAAQYKSLRALLAELKDTYHIDDDAVLTHSMVAYGRPNRFHPNDHRGRKRCGMLFARPEVRAKLGLTSQPDADPDVAAGRLRVADRELFANLFHPKGALPAVPHPAEEIADAQADAPEPAAPPAVVQPAPSNGSDLVSRSRSVWQIARDRYDQPGTLYTFPDGRQLRGDQIEDWTAIPAGTRVSTVGEEPSEEFEGFLETKKAVENARNYAGDAWAARTTIYFFPDGLIRTGRDLYRRRSTRALLSRLPQGTRILTGYVYGGHVKSRRRPAAIAGAKWNYPSTYYRLPDGKVVSGDEIDAADIPAGTLVFFQS